MAISTVPNLKQINKTNRDKKFSIHSGIAELLATRAYDWQKCNIEIDAIY
jgi:hypothetical protein